MRTGEPRMNTGRMLHVSRTRSHSFDRSRSAPLRLFRAPAPTSTQPLRLVLVDPTDRVLEKRGNPFSPCSQDEDDYPSSSVPSLHRHALSSALSHSFSLVQQPPFLPSWRRKKSGPRSRSLQGTRGIRNAWPQPTLAKSRLNKSILVF